MKTMVKAVVAVIATFVVMVPTAAFAADGSDTDTSGNTGAMVAETGGTEYATLAEAINAAEEGGTVTLLDNTSEDDVITVSRSITLDLNGYEIVNNVTGARLFSVTAAEFMVDGTEDGSGMTIPEGNTGSYGFIRIAAPSTVTLNGGTYTGDTDDGAFIRILENASGSTVVLNDLDMTSNGLFFNTDTLTTEAAVPTLQVTGGTYVTDGMAFGVDTLYRSAVTFTGTTVEAGSGPCIEVTGSEATFEDCNFIVTNDTDPEHFKATAVAVSWDGAVTIDGGTYRSTGYGVYAYSSGGSITVKDGVISGDVAAVKADVDSGTYSGATSSIIVEGGRTEGAWMTNGDENATLTARGGAHTADVAEYIEDGAIEIKYIHDGETLYYVGTESQINAIVEDAVSGDSIDVIKGDIDLNIPAGGVEVSNSGGGAVTVNDEAVTGEDPVTTTEQPTTDPTRPESSTSADNAEKNGSAVSTGDESNLTALFALMGTAAAVAAGIVVYGRKKSRN